MTLDITYRPLGTDWPDRTPSGRRQSSRFRRVGGFRPDGSWSPTVAVPWSDTVSLLRQELRFLRAADVVLQLDVDERDIRLDGLPRADARPASPAVILSFRSEIHGPLRYFCDRFTDWKDNIRAIALGLEALRKVDRYGIARRGEQYAGWKALPPGSGEVHGVVMRFSTEEEAARFLAAAAEADADRVWRIALNDKPYRDDLFRRAAKRAHPDAGGSRADWDSLVEARRLLDSAAQVTAG